jgi:branched-chain amino acid transport system ATP-binding protein
LTITGILGVGAVAAAAAIPFVTANTYYLFVAILIAITIVVTTGLNILAGSSGQVSLGQAGFYALGAYTGAIVSVRTDLSFWIALPLAAALGAIVGMVLGRGALRVSGPYLAMVTISFGIIVEHGLIEWTALTGGFGGITGIPRPHLGPLLLTLPRYYYLVLTTALASLLLAKNLARSPWGRALVAVRDSETAAAAVGLDPHRIKTTAFAIGAAFAAVGGCLYAFLANFVSPDSFTLQTSILFLLVVLFGGLGRVLGPVVGSVALIVLPELLHGVADYRLVLYGALLLGSIYFLPEGVAGAVARRRPDRLRVEEAPEPWRPAAGARSETLAAEDAEVRFGGIAALAGTSLALRPRTVHGLIGPNGAGKTTLLNVLTGFYRPTAGALRLGARSLAGEPPHRIARAGVARTFQTTQLFESMRVMDNVAVGLAGARTGSLASALLGTPAVRRGEAHLRAEARGVLAFVGYPGEVEEVARNLPFGHKRLVEIARALATGPHALLLDEPAAGLAPAEIAELARLIVRIRAAGVAVLLVGHHMDLVMGASDTVTVLNQGRRIAEGTPAEVQRDAAVREAYLGPGRDDRSAPASTSVRDEGGRTGATEAVPPLLDVRDLAVAYGRMAVVHGVSLRVRPGEIAVILGANGAGKTTALRAITGLLRPARGSIRVAGKEIAHRAPHWIARHGIAMVPEGRLIFPDQTVLDNLRLGAHTRRDRDVASDLERQLQRFPVLRERLPQLAGTLSGGEQQMLAIARSLMARPRLLLLDEPSLGLAPRMTEAVFAALRELRDEGLTLLVVEQMAELALDLADRAYVLEQGRLVADGPVAEVRRSERLEHAYLGRTRGPAPGAAAGAAPGI